MSKRRQKCILYARFSPRPKKALKDCQSIGQQLEECRRWAKDHDYQIMNTFVDEGKSRNDFDRPGFLGAIKELKRGWKIIAVRPDRVGSGDAGAILGFKVDERGASIEYTSGDINGDDPAKRLIRAVLNSLADYERAMTGIRTSAGMQHRQDQGERMTRSDCVPIGKMVDPKDARRMVDDPDEKAAIELIRTWRRKGESVAEMTRRLNVSRYKPRGERWHRNTVVRIIDRIESK